jgi:hypothetical protein
MNATAITLGLVFAFAMIGALHVFYPPTDPLIPQVLS